VNNGEESPISKQIFISNDINRYNNRNNKKFIEVINYNPENLHICHLKSKYIKYRQLNKNHLDIKATQYQNYLKFQNFQLQKSVNHTKQQDNLGNITIGSNNRNQISFRNKYFSYKPDIIKINK